MINKKESISKGLKIPSWNAAIWRYMSIAKFLDLIVSNELYFTNATNLTDKFEGTLPEKYIEWKRKGLISRSVYSKSEIDELINAELAQVEAKKNQCLVNCWSKNPNESYALWKIYLGGSNEGVAIKSNVKSLIDAINVVDNQMPDDIYVGEVEYGNTIPNNDPNVYNVLSRKSPYYEYESELRLFMVRQVVFDDEKKKIPKYPNGLRVSVDVDTLINQVYISPFAPSWFRGVFLKAISSIRSGLESKVVPSRIKDK